VSRGVAPRRGALALARGAACAALLLAALPRPARASYEEFASLDVARAEEDDENLLDHVLVRPPEEWRDEWEHASGGFRSSQGCFTSGQWFLDNLLRVRVPMGDTTRFEFEWRQVADDEVAYDWTQLDVRFPLPRLGLWGVRFRPTYYKSRQDAALLWDVGHEATRFQARAVFGLEDVFNKFWSARQSRVGAESEPYERHPYEPALGLAWRGSRFRAEAAGKWLTPSVKRFDTNDPALRRRERLWGVRHDATVEHRSDLGTLRAGFEMVQASSWAEWDAVAGDHHVYRRRWRAEGAFTRPLGAHARLTFRYFYQERAQVWRPPIANSSFSVVDRMPMVEAAFLLPHDIGARVGFMRNRVTVGGDAGVTAFTWGTRVETRAFLSLQRRFGRVWLQGTEGIELDREPYDVAFVHDKGFVQIQTTF